VGLFQIKLNWYKTMNKINDVSFKYDCIPFNAHPLQVKVDNRLLSLAGDNNLQAVGADYTRTYLLLIDIVNGPNERTVLDEYAITPKLLADAMHWVVTGDEALLASNYAFI
jgi:hypothetical protein